MLMIIEHDLHFMKRFPTQKYEVTKYAKCFLTRFLENESFNRV